MIRDDVLKYLYEINARCDIKLEEVADDIACMVGQSIRLYQKDCEENGMYREASYLKDLIVWL